jgi:hypothetical protein
MAKKNNSSEDTTPENLDPTTSLPQSTLNRLKDANRMTNYLVQNPNGVGPIMQGKLAPDYNIQKLRDLSYDLNDQVEGGEYQDEKVFKPFKSLSEIDTRRDLAYQSRLAELGFKENTLAYEQELDDNQAWYEEIANAQTKFMGKLFNYTTTGLAGIVYGLGKAATTMDAGAIIDNEVFRAMDDMDDWLNKRFVIHGGADYRQAQERGEWFGNRFLVNPLKTVGDDITDAAAFVGSAILTETAAGLATAASGGFGSGALAANTMKVGITGARLWNRFAGGVKVLRGLDVASDIAKSAKVIQQVDKYKRIAGTARGIMTGGGMESAMIGRDTQDQTLEQLLADHKKQYGRPPTASERARYENTAENAGLNAYLLNLPLVAGSNMLQFPKIFLKGYGSSRKVMKGLELAGRKWGPKYDKLSRAGKIGYWGKKSLGTGITEGFEEFAQGAIEDGLIDYYGSNYSPLATKEGIGYLDAMSTAAYKYAGTTEGIDSMTIGFLMGMIGMPMPTNFKTGKKTKLGKITGAFEWHGGAFGEIKEARREIKEVRKAAEKLNNTDAGTALQESYQNFVRNIQIQNDKDEAIASGDIFEYKNKEHDSLFSYTMSRFNIGLEDTIFQELDALEKMSTEDFNKNYGIKGLEEWDDNSKRETLTKARQKITDILEVTTNTQTIMDSKFGNVKPEDAPMYRGLRDQLIYTAAAVQNANSREQELNRQITDRSWEGINTSRLDEATFKLDKKSAKEGYVEFKEEYDKIMDEEMDNWKKNNPATYSINNQLVKDLYQDLKKLKIRRNSAAELFEFLMTPKGTKLFNEFDAKVKEKQAELLKEYTEQKTKENLEKAQNQKEVNRVKKDAESNGTVNAVNKVKESEANKISDQIDKKRTAEEQAIAELEAELMDEMVPPEGAPVGDLKDLASQKEDNKDPNDALKSMVDTAATDRSIKGQEAIDYIVAENAKVLLNSILETVGVNYDISDINSVADLGSAAIAMKDSERWAAIQVAAIEEVETLIAKRNTEAEQRAQKRINESELEDTTKDNNGVDGPSVNIAETQKDTSTEDDANNGPTFLDELSSENPGGTLGLQVTDETIILITHDKEFKEGLKEKKSTVIDETTGKPKENPFKENDQPRLDSDLLNNPNFLPARETNEEDVEVTISSLNNDWNNKEKNQTAELMAFGVFKDGVYLGMLPEFKPQMPEHFLALRKAAFAAHKENKAIKHTLVEKINTRVNNARVATINPPSNVAITPPAGAPIKNSPVDVIEQAKQEGATFVTKDGKEIELDLWLISKISDNGAGVIKDNNLPKEVKDAIKDLNPDRLTTGMVYMLVPHPKGLFPIRLFSNTFQDSDEAFKRHLNESLKELKNAAIEKKIEEFNKVKARLEGYFHKISFNYDPNIGYLISSQNPVTTNKWGGNILPNSSSSKPIDVFKALKDEILKVGFKAMNKSNNNARYSKNGFISTDVFSQNGNFFHSSGFVLDSYSEPEAIELVDKVENAVQVEQQIDANNTISAKNKIINDVPTPRKESVLTEKQAKDVEAGKKVSAAAIKKVQEKALKGEDELTSAEEKVLKDNPIEEFEISKEEILIREPISQEEFNKAKEKVKKLQKEAEARVDSQQDYGAYGTKEQVAEIIAYQFIMMQNYSTPILEKMAQNKKDKIKSNKNIIKAQTQNSGNAAINAVAKAEALIPTLEAELSQIEKVIAKGITPQEAKALQNTEIRITYTPKGKAKQRYRVKGTQIFNAAGKEVFKTKSADRNKIFANVEIKKGTAKVIEYKGKSYVVNNKNQIMSVATSKIMKWKETDKNRIEILAKYNSKQPAKSSESTAEQTSEVDYNFNPTNVSEERREEYKKFVIDKLGNPLSIEFESRDEDSLYKFTFKDGTYIETPAKGKMLSYPKEVSEKIVELSKKDAGYGIKFLIGLNKLAEVQSTQTSKAEALVLEMVRPNGKKFTDFTIEEQKLIDSVPLERKKELQLDEKVANLHDSAGGMVEGSEGWAELMQEIEDAKKETYAAEQADIEASGKDLENLGIEITYAETQEEIDELIAEGWEEIGETEDGFPKFSRKKPKRKKRKKGKSIIPLTDTNNADSSTLRERSLKKVDGTKFNEQEEVAWLKDKLGKQVVENTTMFNSIEDLQKYLPEEVYSMLLNARKNGRNLHGLFSTAALYLNRNAFEGTAYHEAFHIVFHLALPVEQRLALIKEAREKYKDELEENASEIQVEEVLADKFMEYVQSKEASKKGLPSKIKDFFKRMYRMIKTFFNGESNVSINEVFENIQLGLYKNKPKFQNTNLTQLATGSFRTALREETYDNVNEEQQALNYLRNRYFKLVDQLKKTTHKKKKTKDLRTRAEVIAQVGETYLDNLLLNDVLNNIDNWNDEGNENLIKLGENLERVLLNNSFEDNYSETTKDLKPKESAKLSKEEVEDLTLEGGFDFSFGKGLPEFMRKFHRYLALDGLKFQDNRITTTIDTYETDQISNEDEESTQEENWFKSHIEINPEDSASQELRYFLNSIPKYDSTRKDAKIVYDAFGEEIREDSSKVFKYLAEKITNTTEGPDQMMDKLEALKNSKPYIRPIIEKLNDPKNAGIKSDMYIYLASKQYIKFLTVLEDNGVFKSFYSNRKSTDYLIAEELVSNFLNEKNKLFQDKKVGTRKQKDFEKINITEAKKFKTSIKQILDKVSGLKSGKKEEDLFTKKFSNNKTFIENIALELSGNKKQGNYGFNLTAEDLQKLYVSYDNESAITNFRRFLEKIDKVADQLVAGNNPFLLLKAQDEVDKTTVSSSVVERLAEDYKRIFAGEVQSSSRNVDNKTVYNVQLANFLSRTIAKWKDGNLRTDFMTFVSEDPLLNKSPLLKDLQNNPDLVDQMEVVLLDGLKREGKSTGTKYTRLSPIEYEATAMAAFRYAGSTYGYYKMPIPADAPTMPFIKLEKYSEEEVIDRLTDVAEGEYYRINKLRNLPTNSKLRNIKNYVKNGTKFSLLTFLNDEVNTSKPFNKTAVRESIKTFLNDKTDNGYLGSQLKALKDKKVIENYDLKTGKIVFSEGVIDSRETNKLEFIKSYLFNSLYVNTQMTSLLATDPAFYSGTVDYQKRYKQVIGPKLYLDPSKVRPNYYIKAMKDEELPSKKETAEAVQELLKNSSLSKQEQKEITAIWSFTEDVHNTTDAQTYLHPRRYKEVMEGLNRWSDEMEAGYKRILAGKDIAEDIALFPPIKPFMFTQNKIEGTVVGMQVKNSEAMLTPSLALQKNGKGQFKYPDLAKVYQTLNTATTLKDGTKIPGIDALVFESAIKNGLEGIAPADKDGKPVLATIDNIGKAPIISLKNSDWGLQQETPAHYLDDLNNYGTQFRNLIIADLNMEGIYNIEGKKYTGKEVAKLYQDTIITDLEQSYEKVEKLFLDKNGDVNYAAILDKLQSEIDRRDLGDDARSALDYYVKENPAGLKQLRPTLPLYHPVHTIMIQNILNGIFNKSITKQTTSGGAVVNTSSYGISDSLNFDPETGTYEVLMPWTSKKYFPKDANGNIDLSKLPDEIKELVGYRIPTEDKYSMFKMKIVGFTPASMGGTLILPREATTIAGLDFDIDKLYIITPAFKVKKNGDIIYKKPINKNTPTAEAALQIFEDTAILERFLNDKFDAEEVNKILEFKNKINEDIVKNKQGLKKENAALYAEIQSVKKLKSLATDESSKIAQQIKLDELYEQMAENKIDYDSALEEQYNKSPYKEILEKAVADADNIEQYNGKAERDNLKLEIIKGILSNPHTLESILPGGSFEQQELLSAKIRLLKAGEVKKANSLKGKALKDAANSLDAANIFNILYPSTQLELFERNMTGRELTGIIANQNSHHAKALFTNMKLKVPVKVVLKNGAVAEYDALNESKVNEQRVSKNLSSLLAAVVDNAKVPLSSFLNFNSFTADTVSLMTRLGIDEEVIFYLMNQPIIIQLSKTHFAEKGNLSEENLFKNIVKEWRMKLKEKGIESKGIPYELNKTALEDSLIKENQNTDNYYTTQYQALLMFSNLKTKAEELALSVQASRMDTKGLGATVAEGFVFLDKQRRLLELVRKNENSILGITETFDGTSDQRMMAKFNELGIQKPLSLMDRILPYSGKFNEETGQFELNLLGQVKAYISDQKGKTMGITEKEARLIESQYMGYIASKFPFFNNSEGERIVRDTPEKLRQYKLNNPKSKYSVLLDAIYVKDSTKKFPLPTIQYYKTGKKPIVEEQIKKTFQKMLELGTKEEKDLAFDLIKYAYHTTAFEYTPLSYLQTVPTVFWTDDFARKETNKERGLTDAKGRTFNEVLEDADNYIRNTKLFENPNPTIQPNTTPIRYQEEGGGLLANHFIHQFIQNNFEREGFVKSVPRKAIGISHNGATNTITINKSASLPYYSYSDGIMYYVKRYNKLKKKMELFSFYTKVEDSFVYKKVDGLGATNFLKIYNAGQEAKGWLQKVTPATAAKKGPEGDIEAQIAKEIEKQAAAEAATNGLIVDSQNDIEGQSINFETLKASLATPETTTPTTTQPATTTKSAFEILEDVGQDFDGNSLEILVSREAEKGISEQDVAQALINASANSRYSLAEMLHANKVWQPEQGEEIDLSSATLGEKNKINLYNTALKELSKPTQQASDVNLGTETAPAGGNVVIDTVKGKKPQPGAVVASRTKGKTQQNMINALKDNAVGNPFGPYAAIITKADGEAVTRFLNWLEGTGDTNVMQNYRKALLAKVPELQGKTIYYYKDLGRPSHATALDYFLNKKTTQPAGKVSINTTRWTKDSPKENPSTAYVFTENINSIGSTRVGGGSAVIRNNPNAIGIVTKKYYTYKENRNSSNKEQWNANFQDTDADFELFKKVNLEQFAKLDKFDSKIFPDGFANSLASVPNKFALWLQNELQTRYGLVTEVNSKGTGLISKSVQQATQPAAEETSTTEVKKEGGFNLDALKAMTSESRNSLPYTTKTKSGKTIADAGISLEAWVQMSVEEQNKHIECN